jgi:hypothetical protein
MERHLLHEAWTWWGKLMDGTAPLFPIWFFVDRIHGCRPHQLSVDGGIHDLDAISD